jgi:hypothetical protein
MNEDTDSIIKLLDKINNLYPIDKKPTTSANINIKPDVISSVKSIIDKQISLMHEIVDYISVLEHDNNKYREEIIDLKYKLNESATCHI